MQKKNETGVGIERKSCDVKRRKKQQRIIGGAEKRTGQTESEGEKGRPPKGCFAEL